MVFTISRVTAATGCASLLLALAYLMPGHYSPWPAFEQQAMAGLAGALLLWSLLLSQPSPALRPGTLGWAALLLMPLPVLQHMAGQVVYLSDAVLPALYLGAFTLAVICARGWAPEQRDRQWTALCMALVATALVSAGQTWDQWLDVYTLPGTIAVRPGDRPTANLAQPNHLASLLMLGLMAAIHLHQRKHLNHWVATLLAAFLLTGVVLAQSRTAWLACILVTIWLLWKGRCFERRLPAATVLIFFTLTFLASAFLNQISGWLLLSSVPMEHRLSPGGTRLVHWATLADAAFRQPWFGFGFNQVNLAQLATTLDHSATHETLTNSHNMALDLALWAGLPAALLVLGPATWWWVRQIRLCATGEQVLLLACFTILALHSMLEFPLDYLYFLIPMGLFVGQLDSRAKTNAAVLKPPLSERVLPRWAGMSLAVAVTVTGAVVVQEYLEVQAAAFRARLHQAGLEKRDIKDIQPPQVQLLDEAQAFHRVALLEVREGMTAAELQDMRQVTWRHPHPPLLLHYAVAAGLNGQAADAQLTLKLLCHVSSKKRCTEVQPMWRSLQVRFPHALAAIAGPVLPSP